MSDSAASAAFDGAAPEDERSEALGALQREYMPTQSDLLPPEHVRQILQFAEYSFDEPFAKAIADNGAPFPSEAARKKLRGMQSVQLDGFTINIQGDFWERPTALSYDSLRLMVAKTPILNAVAMTRVRQVQRFCRVAEKGVDAPGFDIRHVDRKHQLTKAEQESIGLLNRFMVNCGWEFNPRLRKSLRRDSLSQFMAKSVRDSLVLDSAPIETEWKRNKKLGIDGFYPVDGATIRLCTEDGFHGNEAICAIQLVEGRITAAYTHDDLIYEPRNPRTEVNAVGYGISETELLVRVVSGYLNAMTYNIKGFDSNQIPKGVLNLVGDYSEADLKAFRRYWNSLVKGVSNAWTLPVLAAKNSEAKATFEKFGVEFNEMYFAKWMTFLTSIICALWGMSPAEINFDSFSGGNTSPLSGSDTAERLAASKDSGLRPLLAHYENLFSDFLIAEYSDNLVFRWTGLDPEDKEAKQEMRKLVLTVNEIRAEEGHEAMEGPLGDAPVNPALIQPWMAFNGPQPAEGADGGAPGAPTGAGGARAADPDAEPNENDTPEEDAAPGSESSFGEQPGEDFGKAFNLPPIYSTEDMLA
ncbi:phage portal protein [Pararobbsia silviterrae]|uniref:Phage portal protein n=1 Tax=Pararobbsia silviterrae TaxID=1792498 RepID=A0A494X1R7_9BURK|nr:phage portal protein [Pararobbsia silviterrae]RKP44665.1 phage portal protein [Pararobbsia silviterrae]